MKLRHMQYKVRKKEKKEKEKKGTEAQPL